MLNYLTERYRHILWNLTLRWSFNPATSPPPPSLLKTSMARCCRAGISQLSPSLLTWAAPGPSNPFSQKPHPFPPSASGTPRSPRKLLLPPSPMLLQNRADPQAKLKCLWWKFTLETKEMPEVRIALGGSAGSEQSCCSLGLRWEWGAKHFCRCHRGGRALSCLLKLRGGERPSKCNCGVWWLFYNLGL